VTFIRRKIPVFSGEVAADLVAWVVGVGAVVIVDDLYAGRSTGCVAIGVLLGSSDA